MNTSIVPTLCGVPFRGWKWRDEWLKPGLSTVYTVNSEFLYWTLKMPEFLAALRRGDCTADGKWVQWLLNLKYPNMQVEHLPGSRIIFRFLEEASRMNLSIALIGSTTTVLETAKNRIVKMYGLKVYYHSPGFIPLRPSDSEAEVRKIRSLILEWKPDIVFIALGPPKQELLIDMLRRDLEKAGTRLAMGVGGTLEMIAGVEKPAPRAVAKLGLEWLWRLIQKPRRWRKVLRSLRGLACGLREALGSRLGRG